jgi:glycosyltransferase involved in cell wall biosynthesis
MRIAMIAQDDGPNARYRVFHPMEALGRRGHDVFGGVFERMADPTELLGYDVVHCSRLYDPRFRRLARGFAERGVGFVWDNDDNLTQLDVKGRPNHRVFSGLSGRRIFGEMAALMRTADIVTTPSSGLAEVYREATGADVRVVENYVRFVDARQAPRAPREVVVGWVAHVEHQTDIERLRLREPMQRLLDRNPHLHVVSIGCGLGLTGDRYHHIRRLAFEDLREQISRFDLGIAPIADTPFNRGRSNVKVKEYAAMGVPWLASPIGPYASLGQDEGGVLVADDRWCEEIERLARDHRARRKLGKRAAKWASAQTVEANAHRWEAVLREAAERARARRG